MASRVDLLLESFDTHVRLPWQHNLAGPQRVWFAVYDKADERKIRYRLTDFELATTRAGHPWKLIDLSDAFATWLEEEEFVEAYFETPEFVDRVLPEFQQAVVQQLEAALRQARPDSVLAVLGVGCLFGFLSVAELIRCVSHAIQGRILIFFPGTVERNAFYLLDANAGWDYLAVVITAHDDAALGAR